MNIDSYLLFILYIYIYIYVYVHLLASHLKRDATLGHLQRP